MEANRAWPGRGGHRTGNPEFRVQKVVSRVYAAESKDIKEEMAYLDRTSIDQYDHGIPKPWDIMILGT